MTTKLSIVIPVYNMEQYVEKCLLSITTQPFISTNNIQIIVVDDGSTDNSGLILKQFKWNGVKHIILNKENGGLSSARNYGFLYAEGEYTWFVDSDDWISNDCISEILPFLDGVDALHFSQYFFTTDNNETIVDCHTSGISGKEITKREYHYPVQFSIYRTGFLKKHNLFFQNGIVMEDLHFTPRALYLADTVKILNFPVYHYYQREGSIMREHVTLKRIYDRIWISKDLYRFMNETVEENDKEKWAECIVTDVNAIMYDACRSHDSKILDVAHAYIEGNKTITNCLRKSNNLRNRIWYYLSMFFGGNFYLIYNILYKIRYKDI